MLTDIQTFWAILSGMSTENMHWRHVAVFYWWSSELGNFWLSPFSNPCKTPISVVFFIAQFRRRIFEPIRYSSRWTDTATDIYYEGRQTKDCSFSFLMIFFCFFKKCFIHPYSLENVKCFELHQNVIVLADAVTVSFSMAQADRA